LNATSWQCPNQFDVNTNCKITTIAYLEFAFHWKLTCSCYDIAEKLLSWHKTTITNSLTQALMSCFSHDIRVRIRFLSHVPYLHTFLPSEKML
jgi:hypothetical protein